MEDVKKIVAELIKDSLNSSITIEEIEQRLESPKDKSNGDLAYPCFTLAKVLKKSPAIIAEELKENIKVSSPITKVEAISGYLNFYVDYKDVYSSVITDIMREKEKYGFVNSGKCGNVVVDYSSPNIAKPFHLGHFRTTVIGRALCNLYEQLGYNVVKINHLGDWGRQFGLLIEGYKRFKDEYDIKSDPLHALSEIYVRINKLAKEDENVMNIARENFKKLEEGDKESIKLWQYFRDVSLKEYMRIYKFMGCEFDSYNGEAFYNDKMDEVVKILDEKKVLVESEGAKVVYLGENEPPCIILKSNGSTIYATRDLAAILYRARTYDFKKAIYVTGYEQSHHFKQIFEVAKYLVGEKYASGLVHVPYGMVRLKTGRMSSRDGNVIYLQDLIDEAIKKARGVIAQKDTKGLDIEDVAKKVGLGALVFNDLKQNKIKDVVFDLDEIIRFDGETGPYVQYTYARIKSVLDRASYDVSSAEQNVKLELLNTECELELIKELSKFKEVIKRAADEFEPCILARYLIGVASFYSRFYNECNILNSEEGLKNARLALCYATSVVVKKGLEILGISCPDRM